MIANKRIFYLIGFLLLFYSCKKDELSLDDRYTSVDIKNEKLPDFSYVGYRMSEEPIPTLPVAITLSPHEGDNYHRIQNSINLLASRPLVNGQRGAILLKAGTYNVSESIKIKASGIVLRGEGQGTQGTIINSTRQDKFQQLVTNQQRKAMVHIEGSGNGYIEKGTAKSKIAADVRMADRKIVVESGSGFMPGDTLIITKTTNQAWIDFLGMGQYGWTPEYFQISHRRLLKGVVGDTLILDVPMVDDILNVHGGGWATAVRYEGMVENSGVENIRFTSVVDGPEDENHVWNAVILNRAENCWVRNITAENMALSAVAMFNSYQNTVQDCAIFNFKSRPVGDRRYPFFIDINCTGNLFQRLYSDGARHPLITGPKISGPNVFLDSYSSNSTSDTGPHNRWATGTLYDNVLSDMIYARNAENSMGHGWTGAYNMFWNNYAAKGFLIQNPPGAVNWMVGSQGKNYRAFSAYNASQGAFVTPRSIFIQQLSERIGASRLRDVLAPGQLGDRPVWDELKKWAGSEKALVTFN